MKVANIIRYLIESSTRLICNIVYCIKVVGLDNIDKNGKLIIVCNHMSNADPLIIGSFARLVRKDIVFMAKKEIFDIPLVGLFLTKIQQIPVDRYKENGDLNAFKQAFKALKNQRCLIIFPEGTRSKTGKLGEGKDGVSLLALKSKTNILTSKVENTFALPFAKKIRIKFDTLIKIDEFSKDKYSRQDYKDLSDVILRQIEKITI